MIRRAPDLQEAVAQATAHAKASGRSATVYDLCTALLDVPQINRMVRETGGDLRSLAAGLSAEADRQAESGFLGLLSRTLIGRASVSGDLLFRRLLVSASVQRWLASKKVVRPADVFIAAYRFRRSRLVSILENSGVSRLPLLRWLCHGDTLTSPPELPEGEHLDVAILNDDFTTMATVVEILRRVFRMDSRSAYKTMRLVHREGSVIVGRYPRAEAIRIVGEAAGQAEAAGAPLRIVVRRPDGPAEQDVAADGARI